MKETEFLEIRLYSKEDLTDNKIIDYFKSNSDLTIQSYSMFLTNNYLYNSLAERCIKFFLEYENGYLRPEKCDASEPIRDKFSTNLVGDYVRWLSQPGGAFFLKKIKPFKMEGFIENHRFRPVFENGKIVEPKVGLPYYLTEVRIFIDKKILSIKQPVFLLNFLKELGRLLNASFGFIALQDEIKRQHYIEDKEGVRYVGLNANSYLTGVYWINYYGGDYVDLIGRHKLEKLSSITSFFRLEEDCLFCVSQDADVERVMTYDKIIALLGPEYFFNKEYPEKKGVMPA